jgi:acetyl-CoA carboxylase biotin carboxyl carrier protein
LSNHLDEFNLTELSYSDGVTTIKVGKENKSAVATAGSALPSAQVKEKNNEENSFNLIKSPMVGTVYLSPEPGAKQFVTAGSKIKKGSTIVIIEAMKTMNHIQATRDGELAELCVVDGEAIEFDQVLAKIK